MRVRVITSAVTVCAFVCVDSDVPVCTQIHFSKPNLVNSIMVKTQMQYPVRHIVYTQLLANTLVRVSLMCSVMCVVMAYNDLYVCTYVCKYNAHIFTNVAI